MQADIVIIGAGSAGCLLANRLSADPSRQVVLIEAGGEDDWIWIKIPVGYLFAIANPRTDWCFKTEPDPGLNGRSIHYARGRVIGGSSSINAMIYMRGQASDYDRWVQATGDDRWGWPGRWPPIARWRITLADPVLGMALAVKCAWSLRGSVGRFWMPGGGLLPSRALLPLKNLIAAITPAALIFT